MKTKNHKRIARRFSPVILLALASLSTALAQAQTSIPASAALPASAADTTKPGFLWRVHQVGTSQPTTIARTESQLAGNLGENIADPSAQGSADDVATAPVPISAPIQFIVSTVINFDQNGADHGNFTPEGQMPGIPGTGGGTDNIAAEVLTWLDLPAGDIVMGVNSDDGFRVTIGAANPSDTFGVNVGEFDAGRGAADSIFTFTVAKAGLYAARLIYNEGGSDASVEWFTQKADGTKVLVNDTANGGIKAYRAVTGSAALASLTKVSPAVNQTGLPPNAPIDIELTEGATTIAIASVQLALNGTVLPVTPTKTGRIIGLKYSPPGVYAPGSSQELAVIFTEGTVTKTNSWRFTVAAYGTIQGSAKVIPDTSKPGFVWNIFANAGNVDATNQRADNALAGLLKDADGVPLANTADPAARGAAIAAAAAANPAYAPLHFEISGVINFAQNAGDDAENKNGNFSPDLQMPGIPASDGTEGIAAEAIAFLELPAGVITMGVNSDDGFRTAGGNPQDVFGAILLGEFNAARAAAADTIFSFVVNEAGVYAFRTLWQAGAGGANIEWFTVKADGTKILVNDVANGGVKSYRALVDGTQPVVKAVSPTHLNKLVNQPSNKLTIVLADGTNPLSDNSIVLKVGGVTVTPTKTRLGSTMTLVYTPTTLQIPSELQTAEISYNSISGGYNRIQKWEFRNLKNIVLPAPIVTENFDSYNEGAIPTGWVAKNFTDSRTAGLDLDNLNSDSYLGWIVVSRERLEGLKPRIFNVAPGQFVNGQETTSLSEGNLLYAESDVRGGNQVQFITTKPLNLSSINNVVMSFSSLYEQNQDSIGAVEYSVDGGANWMPVIYYLDIVDGGGDIDYNLDGTVDALSTLTSANADTANWTDNGVAKGDKYGDALLAPLSTDLGAYIAPRINDNPTIDKIVEVFRLPEAGKKSDVRLRFAQLGTGSWYFGIDNLAFHEDPNPPVVPQVMKFTSTTLSGGNITITWTGGGTLQRTPSLVAPVIWTDTGESSGSYTTTTSETQFFRVAR